MAELLEIFLEAGAAAGEADDVDQHDQPGGEEAVKHEREVSCVHGRLACVREAAE